MVSKLRERLKKEMQRARDFDACLANVPARSHGSLRAKPYGRKVRSVEKSCCARIATTCFESLTSNLNAALCDDLDTQMEGIKVFLDSPRLPDSKLTSGDQRRWLQFGINIGLDLPEMPKRPRSLTPAYYRKGVKVAVNRPSWEAYLKVSWYRMPVRFPSIVRTFAALQRKYQNPWLALAGAFCKSAKTPAPDATMLPQGTAYISMWRDFSSKQANSAAYVDILPAMALKALLEKQVTVEDYSYKRCVVAYGETDLLGTLEAVARQVKGYKGRPPLGILVHKQVLFSNEVKKIVESKYPAGCRLAAKLVEADLDDFIKIIYR